MNKMQKLTCAKVLKVIFYLLGFPLLMLFVAKDSMIFFNEGAFSETAKNGITAALVLWAGFTLLQIGLYLVLKKQQAVRTIILVILAVALMLAPIAGLDIRNEKELDKIRTEYSDKGVKVENYSLQKQWFNAISANKRESGYAYKLNDRVDNVIRTYGLSEYYPKMYRERTQLNTAVAYYQVGGLDGEMIKVTGDNINGLFDSLKAQSPYAYNPNGLLYDGYIFGVENVLELLIKYNEYAKLTVYRPTKYTVADYAEAFNAGCYVINNDGAYVTMKAAGETFCKQPGTIYYEQLAIADAYKKMVSEIEASATNASAYASDAWYNYTNDITEILDTRTGKMTNYSTLRIEEDNYRLTDSRLNAVLGTLFEYLGMNPAINKLIDSLKAQQLLDLVNSLLKENSADLSSGDIGNVVSQLLYGYNNPNEFLQVVDPWAEDKPYHSKKYRGTKIAGLDHTRYGCIHWAPRKSEIGFDLEPKQWCEDNRQNALFVFYDIESILQHGGADGGSFFPGTFLRDAYNFKYQQEMSRLTAVPSVVDVVPDCNASGFLNIVKICSGFTIVHHRQDFLFSESLAKCADELRVGSGVHFRAIFFVVTGAPIPEIDAVKTVFVHHPLD